VELLIHGEKAWPAIDGSIVSRKDEEKRIVRQQFEV
jgi:hypothetical protein